MITKIKLVSIVHNENTGGKTVYFINKELKILLREEVEFWDKQVAFCPHSLSQFLVKIELKKLFILIQQSMLVGVLVCHNEKSDLVKMYLTLKQALVLAKEYDVPLFINKSYLYKEGIYLTPQLIEDILQR